MMTPRNLDHPDEGLIARYLSGDCSAPERLALEQRIAADRAFAAQVDRVRAAWMNATAGAIYDPARLPAVWERIAADTVNASPGSPLGRETESRPAPARPLQAVTGRRRFAAAARHQWLIAAGLVLALGSLATWVVTRRVQTVVVQAPAPMREIVTRRAQRADVYLSDGTHVKLGPATRLRFAAAFGKARDVYLDGQAYFDVAHDTTRRFAVHTPRATASDLGTKFSVSAYGDASATVEVAVEEGAVAITKPQGTDSLLLGASDVGRVRANGTLAVERGVNADELRARLGWTEGRLRFKNTRLAEALPMIARWYDVDVRVAASDSVLANREITLLLTSDRWPDALEVLTSVLDARVEHRGGAVVLHHWNRK